MKNFKFLSLFSLVFFSLNSNSQIISALAIKICDSVKSYNYMESDTIELKQAEIYSELLSEFVFNKKDFNIKNYKKDFNVLNYKLTTELNKTCESFKIKTSFILPFSNLVEVDSVFSEEQSDKINELAAELRNKNRIEILILSIDELYPYNNIDEFSFKKMEGWKIGGVYEKSGLIVVFSKKLKIVRISTTEISKKYLSDENCEKIIRDILIPNFKNDNYYEGTIKTLLEIQEITK